MMKPSRKSSRPLDPLSVGQCFTLASIMEATAPKPGNVHRGADFDDVTYPDFLVAATLAGPIMDLAVELPLGQTILSAVVTTQTAVATNTNLGTILLVAPLAKVPRTASLAEGVIDDGASVCVACRFWGGWPFRGSTVLPARP